MPGRIEILKIRFIRLDDDVCDAVARIAKTAGKRPSEVVNEAMRAWLAVHEGSPTDRRSE